jgi:acyl dehydratase
MSLRVFSRPSELLESVDTELGTSGWATLRQDRIDGFAEATDDRQWIHVDPARAAAGPFGSTIAHGFLTLSLIPHFLHQVFEVHGVGHAVNYGLERVRFPSPAPVNSRVRATIRLAQCHAIDGGVQAVVSVRIQAEGRTKPVCVADVVLRYMAAA